MKDTRNQDKRLETERWVRCVFADDLQSGDDEDYIVICPVMEAGSWLLVLEYYTGIKHINTSSKGTGIGQKVRISKFLDLFSEIIDVNKSTDKNLVELIEYSDEKQIGYSWYFSLFLDKKNGNFVDVRKIFADLYSKYSMQADHAGGLQDILEANRKFKAFIEQKSTEGEKQFFSL